MINHFAEAQQWFKFLRKGTIQYERIIRYLHQSLEAGGLTPEDIGTTETKIQELRVKSCEMTAHQWLIHLRKGTTQYESIIDYIYRNLEAGKLTLENIKTTETEIQELRAKGCKMAVSQLLKLLRQDTQPHVNIIRHIRRNLLNGDLPAKEVAEIEAEIESLKKVV